MIMATQHPPSNSPIRRMRTALVLSALMLISSAASALTYKATCTGASSVPPVSTKAAGLVSVTLVNTSFATGYFYATNIKQMTMAHLHAGAVGKNGPPIVWALALNGTYGPMSGSIKATFTFNPSLNNVSALLAAGLVYFNIHTTSYPAGELRGQLTGPGNISYPYPPPQAATNTPPPMYMILQYQYVSDILEKRAPFRAEHIARAKAAADEGKIAFAGAFGEQPEGGLFIFKDSSEADITAYVQADPYVKNGLVPSYSIKPYAVVVAPLE